MPNEQKQIVEDFIHAINLPQAGDLETSFPEGLLEGFNNDSQQVLRAMRKLLVHDKVKFFSSACRILKSGGTTPGQRYLMKLLLESDLLLISLTDPVLFPVDAAITLARICIRLDPMLDFKLLDQLFQGAYLDAGVIDVQRALRTMKIVSALQVSMHIQPLLLKLMRFTHPQLRSKATLLFCQLNRNPQWAERKLSDEDGRIRANIIEGLWGVAEARDVLCEALRDGNHRVAANALIGLYHLDGIAAVAAPLEAMGSSLKFLYRSTAAFAMGQTADPHFLPLLTEMAKDPNVKVRGMALRALVRIRKRAAEQQRAAVAAEAEPQQPEVQVEVPSEPVEATVPAAPLPAESIST